MAYEVDFLGVGSDSAKSGDAIAIRAGNLQGDRTEQTIVVIDGGFTKDGEAMVEHIKTHYNTDVVDLVISTHPDQDHINGLFVVLEQLTVKKLWIHKPWDEPYGLSDLFDDGRVTDKSIGDRLKESLEAAYALVKLAENKGIVIEQPFTGLELGCVKVLGPTEDFYKSLLTQLDGMPKAKQEESSLSASIGALYEKAKAFFINVVWGEDKLDDEDTTSAKNNTSVITQIISDSNRLLFTGDAGITALENAAIEIEKCTSGAQLSLIQIPHHGSKRNVGPTILNRLIGEPVASGVRKNITAIASTAKDGEPKHAHKAVLNAFTHRGAKVISTRGVGVCHRNGSPSRAGWGNIDAEPYHFEYIEEA